jgi:hypothetical protein
VTLHRDLLEQAYHLANREPKKPRQASLRRALSTAYYALFHFLLYEATLLLFPAKPSDLRARASRAFVHGEMKSACQSWSTTKMPPGCTTPIESQLKAVAEAFVDLQQLRHDADYDLAKFFDRISVLPEIRKVENAIGGWKAIKKSDNAKLFLSALLLHGKWNKVNK